MKLVLDTNVLVSGIGWAGPPAEVLRGCLCGVFQFRTSPELLAELANVLRSPKLSAIASRPELAELLTFLHRSEHLVYPSHSLQVIREGPADNRILEAAIASAADRIISGDDHLLQLGSWGGIAIQTPTELLRRHPVT